MKKIKATVKIEKSLGWLESLTIGILSNEWDERELFNLKWIRANETDPWFGLVCSLDQLSPRILKPTVVLMNKLMSKVEFKEDPHTIFNKMGLIQVSFCPYLNRYITEKEDGERIYEFLTNNGVWKRISCRTMKKAMNEYHKEKKVTPHLTALHETSNFVKYKPVTF
jgi:hypothetical protein